MDRYASEWSCDLVSLGLHLRGHCTCEWRGSSWSICVPSLKFVGLTVPQISLIMCLSINTPDDLELWLFDLETGVSVTCAMGYLATNFGFPSTFCSPVIHYVRDRRTDGRTKATLNAPYPTGGGITSSFVASHICFSRASAQQTKTGKISTAFLVC